MGTPASCCITSLVGTRHEVNKREPSVHEATPGALPLQQELTTSGIHLRPSKGPGREWIPADSALSQAGAGRTDRSESGRQAPVLMLLPGHPNP